MDAAHSRVFVPRVCGADPGWRPVLIRMRNRGAWARYLAWIIGMGCLTARERAGAHVTDLGMVQTHFIELLKHLKNSKDCRCGWLYGPLAWAADGRQAGGPKPMAQASDPSLVPGTQAFLEER